MKTNACKAKRRTQIFLTIPYLNFGLTGRSNGPGPQPVLGGTSSKNQKLNNPTLNQQTTHVFGYQPDVCHDNIVAALKVHIEMINRFPSSALGTSNSYSEHELRTNDDVTCEVFCFQVPKFVTFSCLPLRGTKNLTNRFDLSYACY